MLAPDYLPHVSIVTPFHDQPSALAQTATSVFGQSFQDWEWLIVDDGASDTASLDELTRLRSLDSRVHVLDSGPCRGTAAARNIATQAARGSLIAQLAAGDLLEPTAVEKWAWFLESHRNLSFVGAHRLGLEPDPSVSDKGLAAWPPDLDDQLGLSSGLTRAGVYKAVGGYTPARAPAWTDWEFRLRCASAGYWGGTVPECLSRHLGPVDTQPLDDLQTQYQDLWTGQAPVIQETTTWPADSLRDDVPFANVLAKQRPRLLLLGPWLTVGGADMFNLDLTRFAQRLGWDVTIATTINGATEWMPEFERLTSDVFVLPRFLRPEDFPRFIRYLISSRQIDVVILTHSEFAYTLLPYIRSHAAGATLVDVCHIEMNGWRAGGYPLMAVATQHLLDLNIVTTAHLKEWMVDSGADGSRISVCHTNVDVDEWCPDPHARTQVRADLGIDQSRPVLLYAARICPQKQPMVFAQTLRALRKRGYQFTALVVGDGPDLPELEAFLTSEQLMASVRLLGTASSQFLKRLMQASDIFFLPSEWEGISIAVYEAMACGVPVVTAAVGGQSELVTPDCGVLVERSLPEAEALEYARILGDLIDHPDQRARMSASARKRVCASFRLDQMAEQLATALQLAQTLHTQQPRAQPSPAESTMSAMRAVDSATCETNLLALDAGKAWLHEHYTRWQRVAQQQEQTLTEMREWVADLQQANTWLTDQCASWEKATRDQERTMRELYTWVADLQASNARLSERRLLGDHGPLAALREVALIIRRLSGWVTARP